MKRSAWVALVAVGLANACDRAPARVSGMPYAPVGDLEAHWGRLVAAANFPTGLESGTGYRVGFFLDSSGTVWGIPLTVGADSTTVLGCAPPALRDAPVTDTLPSDIQEFIAATNAPTGYRLGTGRLELLVRDRRGVPHWRSVAGGSLAGAAACEPLTNTGTPNASLQYYRIARAR